MVALREGSELLLMALALREMLQQSGRPELVAWIVRGGVAGLLACLWAALLLAAIDLPPVLDASLTLCFGLALSLMAFGAMASHGTIRTRARDLLEHQLASPRARYWVAGFAAFAAAREGAEVLLFTRYAESRYAGQDILLGLLIGVLACALLVRAWKWFELRSRMLWAFRLSAWVLLVIGIQMTLHGTAMLLMSGLFPIDSVRVEAKIEPFLPGGDLNVWLVAAVLMLPGAVWLRRWWRRA
ncbi:hypothetical protein [Variovorax saccharolyticus]|uniref:hypothetical protein n=1 Tax=Variovorax saccharolyticus TaxID=3053516 RepID=UPI002578C03B|nr:hypothetical protein [Variovorax sp. J31P216]MDM0024554.1 hypothetical protein [Variovorax sp. J31P216]